MRARVLLVAVCDQFSLLYSNSVLGKSTLLRTVALCTILAHLGCYVPAAVCRLTVVDRIFTRLGNVTDAIMEGKVSLFVLVYVLMFHSFAPVFHALLRLPFRALRV